MKFSIEQFYNGCCMPENLIEVIEDANMTGNSNIISSTQAFRFSAYGIAGSIYLILQSVVIIFHNLYSFWPILKINISFRCIFEALFVSNIIFSLTSTASSAFMLLLHEWYLGEMSCLLFKYLQAFTMQFSSTVIIYILFFNISSNTVKTKVHVALFTVYSLFCSSFQVSL